MTESELRNLAQTVEDLKKAVRRNNPLLKAMMSASGWFPLSLMAGLGMALFCLPAQILSAAYGSFEAIPAAYRAALWGVLALVLVASGVWKMVLISRKASALEKDAGLITVLKVLFTGQSFHIGVPFVLTITVLSGFAIAIGHPWYMVPAIMIPTCFWSNTVATMIDEPMFAACGWWALLTGFGSLILVEKAPFIWLFISLGGLCLLFAGMIAVSGRREGAGKR